MKRLLMLTVLLVATLGLAATATAGHGKGKGNGNGKPAQRGKHTFVITSTDNGSCGTPWANDVVKRTFIVKPNGDGTWTLTRRDRGKFVTIGGTSPGACDTTGRHGHTVRPGVKGKLVGFLRGTVSGGTYNPNAVCVGPTCGFTDVFIATFFGPTATFSCFENSTDCKFNFNYTAARHQHLLFRHWQDKGKGAGTFLNEQFHGDIADA